VLAKNTMNIRKWNKP